MTENTASTASTPLSPEELLAIYDVPGASAAEFLCDRHDPDAVAFTVIDPDLSGRDITYGELRTESEKVAAALRDNGVRVEADTRNETLSYRVRNAQKQKVPLMLVLGAREAEEGTISVRRRGERTLTTLQLDEFVQLVGNAVRSRSDFPAIGTK